MEYFVSLFKFVYKFVKKMLQNIGVMESDPIGNPFLHDARLPLKNIVIDQKSRDAILRQDFNVEKVPANLDSIVIGSGIGGLSAAAVLSKAGKKVVVLEQHEQIGGCCSTIYEKGYEFNVGILYVGEMNAQSIGRTYIDQISDGQIQWGELDEEFDAVVFKTGTEKKIYSITGNFEKQKNYLKSEFPAEVAAIDKYYDIIDEIKQTAEQAMSVKLMPIWLVKLLDLFGIIGWFTKFYYWNKRTVKEVVNELTSNQTLRDIFSYTMVDYGVLPSKAGFAVQAILASYYAEGAFFPVGGVAQIPLRIIPVIERGGGKVLVRAEVLQILIGEKGQAIGVKVKHGQNEHDIFAPIIISDAGIFPTEKFLPRQNGLISRLSPIINPKDTIGVASILVGLDATAGELNIAEKKNYFAFSNNDIDKCVLDFMNLSKDECVDAKIPAMFISLCSSKDLSWEQRNPGKASITIYIPINNNWFQDWKNKPAQQKGNDYEKFINTLGWNAINIVIDLFPKIKDHIDYVNIRCPLSFNGNLGRTNGATVLGMDHNQNRFSLMNVAKVRPITKVSGLYLTGQDVMHGGLLGASWGALMCAQQVLDRPLFQDLKKLHEKLMKQKETDKKTK